MSRPLRPIINLLTYIHTYITTHCRRYTAVKLFFLVVNLLLTEVITYKKAVSTEAGVEVRGVVLLNGHLYVVRKNSSQLEVLHPTTLSLLRNIPVAGMTDPGCMAGCIIQKALYITCFKKKELLKISLAGAWNCLLHHLLLALLGG